MKNRVEQLFLQCGRNGRPMLIGEDIVLYPQAYDGCDKRMGGAKIFVFDILEKSTYHTAGEIALRIGEDRSLYYLGHIGYHIDEPYRGRGWAAQACKLCFPFFKRMNMSSLCITTDPDNIASRKTCEHAGGIFETTVSVPIDIQKLFLISKMKCRYIVSI